MIKDPYLSLEIGSSNLTKIYSMIENELKVLEIPFEKTARTHMSLFYMIGEYKKEKIINLSQKISKINFCLKPLGIDVVYSPYFNAQLIILKIGQCEGFLQAVDEVLKNGIKIKEDFNGEQFSTHITLFKIPNKYIDKEDLDNLCDWLEMISDENSSYIEVYAETLTIFDNKREKVSLINLNKARNII